MQTIVASASRPGAPTLTPWPTPRPLSAQPRVALPWAPQAAHVEEWPTGDLVLVSGGRARTMADFRDADELDDWLEAQSYAVGD